VSRIATIVLDDINDPRLEIYREIKATNRTRNSGLFVLEGEKLLERLLAGTQFPANSVLASPQRAQRIEARLPTDLPLYVLSETAISDLVGYHFHLGVLSAGRRTPWESLGSRLAGLDRFTLVVCPAVNDPENLGAIVRISDTFGVQGVIAGSDCPDPLSRRVLRVSTGAVLAIPVWVEKELAAILGQLKQRFGVRCVASVTSDRAEALERFSRPARMALLLGNEAHGLSSDWVNLCDDRVTIPMRPGADSLNVAVAAGILLHRFMQV
jgi:tRNA G18 (ribose-2'-O)-methylase SpoU